MEYVADTPVGVAYRRGALGSVLRRAAREGVPQALYACRSSAARSTCSRRCSKPTSSTAARSSPSIAILEFRQPFQTTDEGEYVLLRDFFRHEGYPTEIVSPDQLEYRNGVLRRGDFPIELIWRRMKVQEFLLRYDLSHPLVRAYRDGAVCVVNSFRSELAHKKAIFDLLTDESITGTFPAVERKAIRQFIPWTRVVSQYQDHLPGPDHRPARVHPEEPREAGAQAERR